MTHVTRKQSAQGRAVTTHARAEALLGETGDETQGGEGDFPRIQRGESPLHPHSAARDGRATGSNLPPNVFIYDKKNRVEMEALVEAAIGEAPYN